MTALTASDLNMSATGLNANRAATIFDIDRSPASFSIERSLQPGERHAAAAGVRVNIPGDLADDNHAAVRSQAHFRFFWNMNDVTRVCRAMENVPIVHFFSARTNRDYVPFLGDRDWNVREIFFLFGFVSEIDLAVRFQGHFAIGPRAHVD